jgi:hypothetical protein
MASDLSRRMTHVLRVMTKAVERQQHLIERSHVMLRDADRRLRYPRQSAPRAIEAMLDGPDGELHPIP